MTDRFIEMACELCDEPLPESLQMKNDRICKEVAKKLVVCFHEWFNNVPNKVFSCARCPAVITYALVTCIKWDGPGSVALGLSDKLDKIANEMYSTRGRG